MGRLKIQVEDKSDAADDIASQMQRFSYSVHSASPNELQIQIDFKKPTLFAVNGASQQVKVWLEFSDFEPGWDDVSPIMT